MSNVDDYIPAQIELNGAFVMRAGENKDSAAEIHAYDQDYPYLSIEPATPIAPGSINVPRTGDDANLLLWSALACISLLGMMTLSSRRKEA